jgi:hypothetical protein
MRAPHGACCGLAADAVCAAFDRQTFAHRLTQICFDRLGFIPGYIVLIIAGGGVVAYNGAPPWRP